MSRRKPIHLKKQHFLKYFSSRIFFSQHPSSTPRRKNSAGRQPAHVDFTRHASRHYGVIRGMGGGSDSSFGSFMRYFLSFFQPSSLRYTSSCGYHNLQGMSSRRFNYIYIYIYIPIPPESVSTYTQYSRIHLYIICIRI